MINRIKSRCWSRVAYYMAIVVTCISIEATVANARKPPVKVANDSKSTKAAAPFRGYVGRVVHYILYVVPPGASEEAVRVVKENLKKDGFTETKDGMLSPPKYWSGYVVIGNRSKSGGPGPLKAETAVMETILPDGQFVIRNFPTGATTGQIYRDLGAPAPEATFHLSTLVPWGQVPKDIKIVVPMSMDPSGM